MSPDDSLIAYQLYMADIGWNDELNSMQNLCLVTMSKSKYLSIQKYDT